MPEQRETTIYESGRATTLPGIHHSSVSGSASKGYIHTVANTPASPHLINQSHSLLAQSSLSANNYKNYINQTPEASPCYTPSYSPCPSPSPSLSYSYTASKTNSQNAPFQSPDYTPNYSASAYTSVNTYTSFQNNDNSNNNNFQYPTTSKSHLSSQHTQDKTNFSDRPSSLYYSKNSKSSSSLTPKYTPNYANYSYYLFNQPKFTSNKEKVEVDVEKNLKAKKNSEVCLKSAKGWKDNTDLGYNIEEVQQFLSKHGTKIKSTQAIFPEPVKTTAAQIIQKKSPQESLSQDLSDVNTLLGSYSNKYKAEEALELKKKESSEDSKLMNDFLTKIILENEEKRFKSFDDKKKSIRKDIDDYNYELEEKKVKRDAMSHYQEDKSHHKRAPNYGDFNQWDFLNQPDIQTSNNHSRRGHYFGGTSQPHSMGWNPMGIPRQSNPYYSNPHGHVMPAHTHTDYRYNQWNNPNHKSIPNIQNAHSQNAVSQAKLHGGMSNSVQDFGLSAVANTMRNDIHSTSTEKTTRPQIHTDILSAISPAISALRTPSIATHPKSVVNNPLSDLQMLVTNQDNENSPQKPTNYQQESVDLSAHSETPKPKEVSNENNKSSNEIKSPISVIQIKNKPNNEFIENDKPVELTSKVVEKAVEAETESEKSVNNIVDKVLPSENPLETLKESTQSESKKCENVEESVKTSVIVEKNKDVSINCNQIEKSVPKTAEPVLELENEKPTQNEPKTDFVNQSENLELSNNAAADGDSVAELKEGEVDGEKTEDGGDSKSNKRKACEDETEGENKKVFLEVESQLEKMFEGIAEESTDLPAVSSTSTEAKPSPAVEQPKKPPKKKPGRKTRAVRLSSGHSSSSESHLAAKKFKSISSREEKKKLRKNMCDVFDRRGPILHIEGSKESPLSVTVINFPKGDDEDEKDRNSSKKQVSYPNRPKHHNELDYRGRSKNGLFSSTLSARYDAHTTDHTWVCVFCKKGPHYNTLGDLFGPYIISKDESTSLCDFSGDEKDISDAQKRGGRNKKSLRSNNMVEHFQKMSKKLRRAQSSESCLTGMTVISDDQFDQLRYEVWVHEQCAVWSPNVCLIGSRIVGMQEAIWSSVKTMCSKCGAFGANIGCVYRNCPNRSHYYCAKESGWSLEQDTFISTCHIHKPRS